MKKLYPSGRAMPTRTGPSEPTRSSHNTSSERMTTSVRSLLRAKSVSLFYSSRRQAKVSSMSATSNLYDVLKRVDWLAIFSPWHLINKAKRYTTLLLPTIFVSVFICFSGAAKAQSRQDVGTAEVVRPLQIGDTIPEELWNMPLQVVNHPEGKDTITLNDYRDKKLIILDFWATWCAPCIRSMKELAVIQD